MKSRNDAVELHANARSFGLAQHGPESRQKRFNIPPLDVRADRVREDRGQRLIVPAHILMVSYFDTMSSRSTYVDPR